MPDPDLTDAATPLPEAPPATDFALPFHLEASNLRGRFVRLGPVVSDIVARHAYPPPVARLVAEAASVAVLLSNLLKYDGIFTLQAKGDGLVRMLVADVTTEGVLRAYAQLEEGAEVPAQAGLSTLLGDGYLAFTVDQGEHTDRYQGIVALTGETLADSVLHYFRQSEQLDTGVMVMAESEGADVRAAGLLVQRMPDAVPLDDLPANDGAREAWRRAMVLMATATAGELTDPDLPPHDVLYRLFHEDGVRVFPARSFVRGCRCSRERLVTILRSLDRAEVEAEREPDGRVVLTCEFCSTRYGFDSDQLDAVYGPRA